MRRGVPRDRLSINAITPQAEADECKTWRQRASMNLVVHIPYRAAEDSARALSLAQQAPTFTIEWVNNQRMAISIFPSLPTGMEPAVQLVGEAVRLSGTWASVDSKRISSLTNLWQRLNCYRDSLDAPDRERYCPEKTAFFNAPVGYEGHRCPVPCQCIW